MASKAAELVVQDILDEVRNGNIPNVYEIQKKHGYSHESARSYKALRTQTAQKTMKNAAEKIKKERDRILNELSTRDLSDERYIELSKAFDTLTKNHQLLTGGNTENQNITFQISQEVADKNNINATSPTTESDSS